MKKIILKYKNSKIKKRFRNNKKFIFPIISIKEDIKNKKIFFLPFQGEFGWYISQFVRRVYCEKALHKVLATEKGHECLFPNVDEFFYDYKNSDDIKDAEKRSLSKSNKFIQNVNNIKEDILKKYPRFKDYTFLDPFIYLNSDILSCNVPIKPVNKYNIKTDIVITPRFRLRSRRRNYKGWSLTIEGLKKKGYSIGSLGKKELSLDYKGLVDIQSWDYGEVDACVELIQNSKLVISTCCGLYQLAILLQKPILLIMNGKLIGPEEFQRNKDVYFKKVSINPNDIIKEVINYFSI
jgi:hypothetical protein